MPPESKITYEMVRDSAYQFLAEKGKMPRNIDIKDILGGASDIISLHMKTWRQEVRAKATVIRIEVPKNLEVAYSTDVAAGVDAKTRDLAEQLEDAVDDADNLRSELGRKREDLKDAHDALDKANQNNAVREAQLSSARTELHRYASDLTRANDEISRLSQLTGRQEAELAASHQRELKLETELAETRAAYAALNEQHESLKIRSSLL